MFSVKHKMSDSHASEMVHLLEGKMSGLNAGSCAMSAYEVRVSSVSHFISIDGKLSRRCENEKQVTPHMLNICVFAGLT